MEKQTILMDRVKTIRQIVSERPRSLRLVDDPQELFISSLKEPEHIHFADSTGCFIVTIRVLIDPVLVDDESVVVKVPSINSGHKRFSEIAKLLSRVSKIANEIEHYISASIVAYEEGQRCR